MKVLKAIVLGGHVQGLGLIRALGKMGYHVTLFDTTPRNIARHSKYCSGFKEIPNKDIIPFLLSDEAVGNHKSSIIFPTNDEQVEYLSRNLNILKENYLPATDSWDIIETCFNKIKTYGKAMDLDIALPDSYFPQDIEEVRKLADKVPYPCIIKPAVMFRFYNSFKKKVFVCKDKESLIANYQKALEIIPANEIIVQDIIPGGSENQYSVGCLFDRDKPIVSIAARRLRQHPIDFGNATTYAETVRIPQLTETAYKLLDKINYRGICEVEFKKDTRDGTFKFLEINPRTWKWHAIAEMAKTPFIESYVQILKGEKTEEVNSWEQAAWSHYITDLPTNINLRMKGLYQKPEVKRRSQAVFSTEDVMPAVYELLYLPYLILSR
ncbi:MAG: ATP-grasp domain-containing protein [Balneolales bacterium]|nr:ATP-grasp domain-containing protein [Balneolales bacterium]